MRKMMVGTCMGVLAFSGYAQEIKMPTVYGQINKAIHYVSQKDIQGYSKLTNVVDVKNSESRLGAKGIHEIDNLKINYNLAIGLDSSYNDGTGAGRVRVRTAEISFTDVWGTIFAGQTGDLVGALGFKLDPLGSTIAGTTGVDHLSYIKNSPGNLGYIDRGRNDQIGYKTPEVAGFQLALASTKIAISGSGDEYVDSNSIAPETATTTHPGSRFVNLLSYNYKFNDMLKLEAHVGYDILKSSYYKTYNDYLGAFGVSYGEVSFTGEYSKMNREKKAANSYKMKNTFFQSSLKWSHGDHTLAGTWANRKNDEGDKAAGTTTDANNAKYTQIAAGYMYNLNKYVQLRWVYAHYIIKTETTGVLHSDAFKNTADAFSFGALVTF